MPVSFLFLWPGFLMVPEAMPLFAYLWVMDERAAHPGRDFPAWEARLSDRL